jgi:hypothetical protein
MSVTLCKKSAFAHVGRLISRHPQTSRVLLATAVGVGSKSIAAGGITLVLTGLMGTMVDVSKGKNPTRNIATTAAGMVIFVVSNVMSPHPQG